MATITVAKNPAGQTGITYEFNNNVVVSYLLEHELRGGWFATTGFVEVWAWRKGASPESDATFMGSLKRSLRRRHLLGRTASCGKAADPIRYLPIESLPAVLTWASSLDASCSQSK